MFVDDRIDRMWSPQSRKLVVNYPQFGLKWIETILDWRFSQWVYRFIVFVR